jgi:hypothetical protein
VHGIAHRHAGARDADLVPKAAHRARGDGEIVGRDEVDRVGDHGVLYRRLQCSTKALSDSAVRAVRQRSRRTQSIGRRLRDLPGNGWRAPIANTGAAWVPQMELLKVRHRR